MAQPAELRANPGQGHSGVLLREAINRLPQGVYTPDNNAHGQRRGPGHRHQGRPWQEGGFTSMAAS